MKNKKNLVLLISGLILSGCAAHSGWTPAIDTYGDKNSDNIQQDKIECDELAKESSSDTGEEIGKGALIGGALGAAAGAAGNRRMVRARVRVRRPYPLETGQGIRRRSGGRSA